MVVRNTLEGSTRVPLSRGVYQSQRYFPHRLAVYSIAAGATLVAADQTQAAIVHHDPADVVINELNYMFNMNPPSDALGDSSDDLGLLNFGTSSYFTSAADGLSPLTALATNGTSKALALTANDPINSSLTFSTDITFLLSTSYYSGADGFWQGVTGYLGVRLGISGNNHYGWARLSVSDTEGEITLHDWAYESNPDTEILAGAVPEPATLGMLALGATGILAWQLARRRKKTAVEEE